MDQKTRCGRFQRDPFRDPVEGLCSHSAFLTLTQPWSIPAMTSWSVPCPLVPALSLRALLLPSPRRDGQTFLASEPSELPQLCPSLWLSNCLQSRQGLSLALLEGSP